MDKNQLIETKKQEIVDGANNLVYEDRLYVLGILKHHLPVAKIIEHGDGCRIHLDLLSDDIIHKIHHIITSRLKISVNDKI